MKKNKPNHIFYFINAPILILLAILSHFFFEYLGLNGVPSIIIFGALGFMF